MSVKFLGQKGFTLPEVMIGAALLGGVALITAKLMEDQAASQIYITTQAEIAKAQSVLENYLNNPKTCKEMLLNRVASSTGTPIGTSGSMEPNLLTVTVPRPPGPDQVKVVMGEANYGQFLIPDNGMRLQTSTISTSVADLVIEFHATSKVIKGRRDSAGNLSFVKRIPVVVQLDGSNRVRDCGPVLSDSNDMAREKMCKSLGGAAEWKSEPAGTPERCFLKSVKCPWGQVATRMTSLGGIICEPLAEQLNASDFFDTTLSPCSGGHNLQITRDGTTGKLKLICNP